MSALKASGISHCGMCPASGILCTARRHRVGIATEFEIASVDELLFIAVQHGEGDSKIAHHRALVAELATLRAGSKIAARSAVGAHNIVEKEGRNIGEAGSEEGGDISGRFGGVEVFLESGFHRRVGQEGLAHPLHPM